MRISRKRRVKKPLIPRYNVNQFIKVPQVRVLDETGENLGVFTTPEAIQMAEEREMDLVEINPKAEPPVAKLINFGNFKYQKEKEVRKQKIKSRTSEVKGIRLSIRISDHDLETRQAQAEKFLNRGDKVQVEIILRGREQGKSHIAYEVIGRFVAGMNERLPVKYEQEANRQGHKVTATIVKK